jgi:hypothetical protein
MKKFIVLLAAFAAIASVVAGSAFADTVVSTPGASATGGASGKGTQVTHYTATYSDPNFGPVSCVGVNQAKAKQPAQDSFTCTSTSGHPLGSLTPGQSLNLGNIPYGAWVSDYNNAWATSLNGTVSADGMSYTATAIYG